MNARQALDYLYQATVTDSSPADDMAEEAVAVIKAYIDELWELLAGVMQAALDLHLEDPGQAEPAKAMSDTREERDAESIQEELHGHLAYHTDLFDTVESRWARHGK